MGLHGMRMRPSPTSTPYSSLLIADSTEIPCADTYFSMMTGVETLWRPATAVRTGWFCGTAADSELKEIS